MSDDCRKFPVLPACGTPESLSLMVSAEWHVAVGGSAVFVPVRSIVGGVVDGMELLGLLIWEETACVLL